MGLVLPYVALSELYRVQANARSDLNVTIHDGTFKRGSVQESDRTRDFSGVGFPAKTGTVAVVTVGMWKPVFGAGFQARGTTDNSA